MIEIVVRGIPAPQGSKRHVGNGRMVEMSKSIGPWREAVRAETAQIMAKPLDGPLRVAIDFHFKRPASHYRTGRNAHLLRDSAPDWPHGRPDIDKLARAVLDGLTMGGAWNDDCQVVALQLTKCYGTPGCVIWIGDME